VVSFTLTLETNIHFNYNPFIADAFIVRSKMYKHGDIFNYLHCHCGEGGSGTRAGKQGLDDWNWDVIHAGCNDEST
jgi:hypothetical protein